MMLGKRKREVTTWRVERPDGVVDTVNTLSIEVTNGSLIFASYRGMDLVYAPGAWLVLQEVRS